MPRSARKKSSKSIYHIMNRSISEVDLFKSDEDKHYYLNLLFRYTTMYNCSIYAYCLMDNHVHLFINPNGFDISCFMHCLNSAYVSYFNKRYNRHGHLYQGRFTSKIVDSNSYAVSLLAYIHNNTKDLKYYQGKEENYPFSSYGIYIGKRKDQYKIVDTSFILNIFSEDKENAQNLCYEFTKMMCGNEVIKEIDEEIVQEYTKNEYRSEKHQIERNAPPEEVIKIICELENEDTTLGIRLKYSHNKSHIRALVVYSLRFLCGFTFKKIGEYIGNMSLSGIIRLSNEGYKLYMKNSKYKMIYKQFEVTF